MRPSPALRPLVPLVLGTLLAAWLPTGATAQEPPSGDSALPGSQLTLTAHVGGVTVGYAGRVGTGTLVGGEVGVGGDLTSVMVLGGSHFGEWLAYGSRDAAGDEGLFEVAHLGAFVRRAPSERFDYDLGVRASGFLHWDDSDDDPGGGLFLGAYATAMFGWRTVKFGPRMQVGLFTEGSGTRELGVYLAPLTGRITFGW